MIGSHGSADLPADRRGGDLRVDLPSARRAEACACREALLEEHRSRAVAAVRIRVSRRTLEEPQVVGQIAGVERDCRLRRKSRRLGSGIGAKRRACQTKSHTRVPAVGLACDRQKRWRPEPPLQQELQLTGVLDETPIRAPSGRPALLVRREESQ
jgi:hypothetical protein